MGEVRLRIITPTGTALDVETDSVRLPAADGSIGIRKGHTEALILLKAGDVCYGTEGCFALKNSAFAKVKDNTVTVITK